MVSHEVNQLWSLNLIFGGVSIALLLVLLLVYARNLRKVWSPFGLGLVVFALLLLAQTSFALFSYAQWAAAGWPAELALPMLFINVAEASAFAVLLAISWG